MPIKTPGTVLSDHLKETYRFIESRLNDFKNNRIGYTEFIDFTTERETLLWNLAIDEAIKIVEEYKDYLLDNYGDIMDIELLKKNVLNKLQTLKK